MMTQDWSQDLLSFRSLNQESVDTLQAARASSLVDGRLAHIVLSDDKRLQLYIERIRQTLPIKYLSNVSHITAS